MLRRTFRQRNLAKADTGAQCSPAVCQIIEPCRMGNMLNNGDNVDEQNNFPHESCKCLIQLLVSNFGTGLVISGVGSKLMKSNTELK